MFAVKCGPNQSLKHPKSVSEEVGILFIYTERREAASHIPCGSVETME